MGPSSVVTSSLSSACSADWQLPPARLLLFLCEQREHWSQLHHDSSAILQWDSDSCLVCMLDLQVGDCWIQWRGRVQPIPRAQAWPACQVMEREQDRGPEGWFWERWCRRHDSFTFKLGINLTWLAIEFFGFFLVSFSFSLLALLLIKLSWRRRKGSFLFSLFLYLFLIMVKK